MFGLDCKRINAVDKSKTYNFDQVSNLWNTNSWNMVKYVKAEISYAMKGSDEGNIESCDKMGVATIKNKKIVWYKT